MSAEETLMDKMKAESDFCSICLQTKAEVKLDPISSKMYQMFFLELVNCVESGKTSRSICVWCRRRVVNALKLVETARTTHRVLTNISLLDNLESQMFRQIVWEQIQATKRTHGLTSRPSQVISCDSLLPMGIASSVKPEAAGGVFSNEGNVCLSSVIKSEMDQVQAAKGTYVQTSKTFELTLCNLTHDTPMSLSVKPEREDGISFEEGNIRVDSLMNGGEMDHIDPVVLEGHNFPASRLRSKSENELTSELDMEEKTPCFSEVRERNGPKSNVAMEKKAEEMEFDEVAYMDESKVNLVDADGYQNSGSKIVNENSSSEFGGQASKDGPQGDESHGEAEDSDTNSQATYTSVDALKQIRLVHLTEAERLQELEERRQVERYRNAPFKCDSCALCFAYRVPYEAHMQRHSEGFSSHKCPICGVYVKKIRSFQQHCSNHYKRYKCTACSFNTSRKHEVLAHYVSQHTNQWYKCELCTYAFGTDSGLKQHMKNMHNMDGPLFPCSHCKCLFSNQGAYNLHVREFNHYSLLSCKVCSRTFRNKYQLRRHQSTHSKENTFCCQFCNKRFKTLSVLQDHMKRKHDLRINPC